MYTHTQTHYRYVNFIYMILKAVPTLLYVHTHTHKRTHICVCVCVCIYVHIYIYICTYIYYIIHLYIYIQYIYLYTLILYTQYIIILGWFRLLAAVRTRDCSSPEHDWVFFLVSFILCVYGTLYIMF
jgi:hypothetical protein